MPTLHEPAYSCKESLPVASKLSKLVILHAIELATELFNEFQTLKCNVCATAKLSVQLCHMHVITQ